MKKERPFFFRLSQKYNVSLFSLYMDCILCRYLHGASVTHYITLELYRYNYKERKQFITLRKRSHLETELNTSPEEARLLQIKQEFNKKFAQYINRDWLYSPESTEDVIREFIKEHDKLLIKPVSGHKGQGIYSIFRDEVQNMDELVSNIRAKDCLIETFVSQHPSLASINESSVNTVRVCSVTDRNGEAQIIAAVLRCGNKGSHVDNYSQGGLVFPIDTETGIISDKGRNKSGEVFLFHPSNHVKMLGFEIPNWGKVLQTVKEASKLLKHSKYIGWDIAITENGCELIEANTGQECDLLQFDGIGKYNKILEFK